MEIPVSLDILIVDDNELHRELISRMLDLVGYSADVVTSGEEALEAIEQKDYSLILMDLAMPRLDGFATTQQIRSASLPDPYIIAVTALNMDNPKEECRQAGMDDVLQKPVLIDDFRAAIARFYTSQYS
ncbi:MAG: response regulator [Rhodothermales bacterium]